MLIKVVQEKRLFAALSLECEDKASKLAGQQSQGLVLGQELVECKQELEKVEDQLAAREDEVGW